MSMYALKVSIEGTDPPVFRTIEVPDTITFHQLHLIFQECFQWRDCHLYEFDVPGLGTVTRGWGEADPWDDDPEAVDSLETLIDPHVRKGGRFTYTYDLGDAWVHVVDVVDVDPRCSQRWPVVTHWQGQSLIEDCGGPAGYRETMRILEDRDDPEYQMTREWVRNFAPPAFDREDVNGVMEERLYFPKAAFVAARKAAAAAGAGVDGADARPRVDLKEAVEALGMQSDTLEAYVDLDTGKVHMLFLEQFDAAPELYEESQAEFESCDALLLIPPAELEDYHCMRDFARSQEGVAGERLARAIEGRGAFKRFKNEVANLGLSERWYAYRDEFRADLLRDYFEAHGVRWK